MIFVGLESEK